MKVIFSKVPQDSKFKAGGMINATGAELDVLAAAGHEFVTENEHKAIKAKQASQKAVIVTAVDRAVKRGAIVPQGDAANSVDMVTANCMAQIEAGAAPEFVVGFIDNMPGEKEDKLSVRATSFQKAINGVTDVRVNRCDPVDAAIKACELQDKQYSMLKGGNAKGAHQTSIEATTILTREIMPLVRASLNGKDDYMLKDLVRANDVTDANVGTLAGSLVLMRNLGFLKNIINFINYISTDLRNEPATYNQPVFTRYIVPPSVTAYNTSTGWADSTPSTVDTSVTLNKHNGVQVTFDTQLLGSTVRNLLSEQVSAQTYALGEQVCIDFLTALFGASWTGIVNKVTLGAASSFGLTSLVSLKNRATLSKMPPTGRFFLAHSTYHDAILTDSNLVTAKAITALVNKDLSALESAELPVLYGLKPLESQLASYNSGVATPPTIGTDGSVTFTGVNQVGFLGNMSSMLMVARIPQDYTTAFKDIPATAAVQVVTDPDSGLSMLNCKYVNHQLAKVSNRLSLMYGFGQGDKRQGIVLTPN